MNYLIAALLSAFDPHSHCRQMAADKNLSLVGAGDCWMTLTTDGQIVTTSTNPIDAIGQLVTK